MSVPHESFNDDEAPYGLSPDDAKDRQRKAERLAEVTGCDPTKLDPEAFGVTPRQQHGKEIRKILGMSARYEPQNSGRPIPEPNQPTLTPEEACKESEEKGGQGRAIYPPSGVDSQEPTQGQLFSPTEAPQTDEGSHHKRFMDY